MKGYLTLLVLLIAAVVQQANAYSALRDARIISEYKLQLRQNHAKVARRLVHQADWAAVGTISTNPDVLSYPFVNVVAIDDSDLHGGSTGRIHFLLTDLDFTGSDWRKSNKVSFLFTDAQSLSCQNKGIDPMDPTCPRVIINGHINELDKNSATYQNLLAAFKTRHPAAKLWLMAHSFYLCELEIENIFVLDFYGGAHTVTSAEFYAAEP